jgi:hypothetical protein
VPPITIIAPGTVTGTGYTLQRYYRRLADELGFYLPTVTTAQASVGEASRIALSTELRDDEMGYDFLGGPWLYAASGAQAQTQRRIISRPEAGYQGSVGAVMVSRPFDAALATATQIEITSPLPVRRHLAVKGLVECINEALMLLRVEAILSVQGDGGYEHDLAAYPFLTNTNQILSFDDTVYLNPTYPAQPTPWGYEIQTSGADHTLVTQKAYSSGETFQMRVVVRADRLVYDGVNWVYRDNDDAPGLQGDDWMAAAPEQWVLAFSMVKALQYVTRLLVRDRTMDPDEKKLLLATDILPRRQQWALAAARIKTEEMPRPTVKRQEPMVTTGTFVSGWN